MHELELEKKEDTGINEYDNMRRQKMKNVARRSGDRSTDLHTVF